MAASPAQKPTLKALLQRGELLVAPRVLDGVNLKEAERAGFPALAVMGREIGGMASYPEMVERVRFLSGVASVPLICDAGTGFGGLLSVAFTVKGYEAAGASAILLEDRERCSRTGEPVVLPIDDAAAKVRVAAEARSSPEFLLVVRVAGASQGLDDAICRGRAYAEAGADVLFVDAPASEAELARVGSELGDVPLLVDVGAGGKWRPLSKQRYAELGFQMALFPSSAYLSSVRTIKGTKRFRMDMGLSEAWMSEKDWADIDMEVAEPPVKKFRTHPGLQRVLI